jgi:transposase InsO family protein
MNIHKNARLTPSGREHIVRQIASGQTPKTVSQAAGVCPRTIRKWIERYRREGAAGLLDRSSRPQRLYRPTPAAIVEQVERLRRQRCTGRQIAAELGISPATVSRILKRLGLNRIGALEPAAPVHRYERARPGELIHLDIKKLGRFARAGHRATGTRKGCRNKGAGWEFVHVAIDDHSRIAFAKIMPSEKKHSATSFLKAAIAYYASLGIKVERVMSDNGSCYKSFAFRRLCKRLGLRHTAPSLIRRRPTARPSASSRPACANGPMPRPIDIRASAKTNCLPGCTATTGIGRMPGLMLKHRSADSVLPRTTC